MNEKLIPYMREYFGYKTEEKSVLDKYAALSPEERIATAKKYLQWAKNGQNNAASDFSYWAYINDEGMAKALIELFTYALTHEIKLPIISAFREKLYIEQPVHFKENPSQDYVRKQGWHAGGDGWIYMVFHHLNNPSEKCNAYEQRWYDVIDKVYK